MEAAIEPQERGLSHKYRRRKLHELDISDLVGIAHARLVEERQRKDIAEEFRVSIGLVSRLSAKCKDGLEFLGQIQSMKQIGLQRISHVRHAVDKLVHHHGRVSSVAQVLEVLKQQEVNDISAKMLRRIMISELGLRFKMLKAVNPRTNCDRAMVQRQQYALFLLNEMLEGKRIINIDESAVGQGVFIRKGWTVAGSQAKHSVKPFGYRLSLLAALDTDGLLYFAVSQANTD